MGRPRTVSDDVILQAARAVFVEEGPSASTKTIAERVGLSQAALFKRFKTKQELMIAALTPPAVPAFVAIIVAGPAPDEPIQDQLRAIGREMALFFRQMVPCVMVLSASGLDMSAMLKGFDVPPPVLARQRLADWFALAMDAGRMRRIDPLVAASTMQGALHMHTFMSHVTGEPLSDEGLIAFSDSVVGSLWQGLAPEAS